MVLILKLFVGLCSLACVSGHAWMSRPQIRGIKREPYKYEPHSLGAANPGNKIPVCGNTGANPGPQYPYASKGDKLTTLPKPGDTYLFKVTIAAHHMGHFTLRLCPFLDMRANPHDQSKLKACVYLNRDPRATEGNDDRQPFDSEYPNYWFLKDMNETGYMKVKKTVSMTFKIPQRLPPSPSGIYTIHYRWETANSCVPRSKAYRHYFGGPGRGLGWSPTGNGQNDACSDSGCCSETFTNCADVRFTGVAVTNYHGFPGGAPTPTGQGQCNRETDCTRAKKFCNNPDTTFCAGMTERDCKTRTRCKWAGSAPAPTPRRRVAAPRRRQRAPTPAPTPRRRAPAPRRRQAPTPALPRRRRTPTLHRRRVRTRAPTRAPSGGHCGRETDCNRAQKFCRNTDTRYCAQFSTYSVCKTKTRCKWDPRGSLNEESVQVLSHGVDQTKFAGQVHKDVSPHVHVAVASDGMLSME